jgi:hypothetical protein
MGTPSGSSGLSAGRLQQFDAAVRADVDKGLIPGAVVLVVRDGMWPSARRTENRFPPPGRQWRSIRFSDLLDDEADVSVAAMIVEEGRMQ